MCLFQNCFVKEKVYVGQIASIMIITFSFDLLNLSKTTEFEIVVSAIGTDWRFWYREELELKKKKFIFYAALYILPSCKSQAVTKVQPSRYY